MGTIKIFNILHNAVNQTIDDIYKNSEANNRSTGKYMYDDGTMSIPTSSMDVENTIIPISEQFRRERDAGQPLKTQAVELVANIREDDNIKRVVDCNTGVLLNILKSIVEENNRGLIYGILVVTEDGKKVNPLHPVVAMMLAQKDISFPEKFTLLIFPYPVRKKISGTESSDYLEKIAKTISAIREEKHLPETRIEAVDNELEVKRNFVFDQNAEIKIREMSSGVDFTVIPVQLATTSFAIPYYGLLASKRTSAYVSKNLFPMESGNINMRTGEGFGSTCTGELNNSIFGSLHVLGNMNINSMYFGETIPGDFHNFVDACIMFSTVALDMMEENTKGDSNE